MQMIPYSVPDEWSDYTWIVVLGALTCFGSSWSIGANDVANAFATTGPSWRGGAEKLEELVRGIFSRSRCQDASAVASMPRESWCACVALALATLMLYASTGGRCV